VEGGKQGVMEEGIFPERRKKVAGCAHRKKVHVSLIQTISPRKVRPENEKGCQHEARLPRSRRRKEHKLCFSCNIGMWGEEKGSLLKHQGDKRKK